MIGFCERLPKFQTDLSGICVWIIAYHGTAISAATRIANKMPPKCRIFRVEG